ncbi:hypothetical protein LH61_04520 [Leuconostoc mesenteroides P45]|nr:hypothetical protein LH61_04520 [Leuconostoc mesenteroides P45]
MGRKPANEADTVLFVGTNFPFSEVEGTFPNVDKFIQIDNNPAMLGKHHQNDVVILGDASEAIDEIIAKVIMQLMTMQQITLLSQLMLIT